MWSAAYRPRTKTNRNVGQTMKKSVRSPGWLRTNVSVAGNLVDPTAWQRTVRGEIRSRSLQEFIGEAAPGPIRRGHLRDQLPQVGRQSRSASRQRLASPEQPEALSMPSDQSVGLDDRKSIAPVEKSGQLSKREPNGIGCPFGLLLTLDI